MSYKTELLQKIENREAVIAVIGIGYVGLPLAVEFAREGYRVIGVDVSEKKVGLINSGVSYIPDIPTEDIARPVEAGLLSATTDYSILRDVDAISICVPTPLRKTKDPDMSYIIAAADEIAKYSRPGQLIVLESTTYPGTTDELIVPRMAQNGYRVGEDIFVCFSPERIDPGNKVYGVRNTPKVIGGVTPDCTEVAVALYSKPIERVIPVSSTRTAEMVKLLENTFRSVNIGLVNEMALMCDKLDVNVWEVIEAASSKPFGFMTFYPGPGLGGHCIPIDPLYLSWKLKALNYNARFIELASEINSNMPLYVVTKIMDALNEVRKTVNGANILILGAAYKRDIDDLRESPALDIIRLLEERGANISYHDPYVPNLHREGIDLESQPLTEETLSAADAVVIVTDHTCLDYAWVAEHASIVVDTRNALKDVKQPRARVVLL
ncbi:MAG TPA: nucleotide sugar dehydrogenase [Aggregatilineales bacterium]|nr:nucleotide sugar dehydrogenase [Aggregatilineales bacterium]